MAQYNRKDPYYYAAKKQGYAARSIFKLEEIDISFSLIKPSARVLDLGCSPGSWLQYVEKRIRDKGEALGVDLLPMGLSLGPRIKFIQGDIYEVDPPGDFDVLLSDMAPNTSGVKSLDQDRSLALCERALEIACNKLKPGGNFCVKILEGGGVPDFVKTCREVFEEVKIKRPKGTRARSMETYIIGLSRKDIVEQIF